MIARLGGKIVQQEVVLQFRKDFGKEGFVGFLRSRSLDVFEFWGSNAEVLLGRVLLLVLLCFGACSAVPSSSDIHFKGIRENQAALLCDSQKLLF